MVLVVIIHRLDLWENGWRPIVLFTSMLWIAYFHSINFHSIFAYSVHMFIWFVTMAQQWLVVIFFVISSCLSSHLHVWQFEIDLKSPLSKVLVKVHLINGFNYLVCLSVLFFPFQFITPPKPYQSLCLSLLESNVNLIIGRRSVRLKQIDLTSSSLISDRLSSISLIVYKKLKCIHLVVILFQLNIISSRKASSLWSP